MNTRRCKVQGCGEKHNARDMCYKHYLSWYQGYRDRISAQEFVDWRSARSVVLDALAAIDEKFLGKKED